MTSGGGMGTQSSLLQPDPIVDVTLQRNIPPGGSVATLNNVGAIATLPRSGLAKQRNENHSHSHMHSHHGTMRSVQRSVDELRTINTTSAAGTVIVTSTSVGGDTLVTPDHLYHQEPS